MPDLSTGCVHDLDCCNAASGTICSTGTCRPCVAPGNAIINGGFGTGSLAPWTSNTDGVTVDAGVSSDTDSQDGDGFDETFVTLNQGSAGLQTITQTVAILDGTTVSCTAFGRDMRDVGPSFSSTFTISIDGTLCGSLTVSDTETWTQFGGNLLLAGDTHTVVVSLISNDVDSLGAILQVDNVQVIPLSGPGAEPVCA